MSSSTLTALTRFRWGILASLLGLFLLITAFMVVPDILEDKTEPSIPATSITLEFTPSEVVDKIVSDLDENLVQQDGIKLGWYFRDGIAEDKVIYNGYQVGTAGIADFLFSLYQEGLLEDTVLLNTSIQILLDQAITVPEGVYWPKTANYAPEGWTGMRYGNIGVMEFLAKLYFRGYYIKDSSLIHQGLDWLLNNQEDDGSYAMTPGSYITTDFEYGAAGIGLGLLHIYNYLDNSSYLKEAERIANWIIDSGFWKGNQFKVPWTPFGEYSEFEDTSYVSYSSGLSGILDFMYSLYEITNNTIFQEISFGIANYLISTDLGGYWRDCAVNYIMTSQISKGAVGLLTGSSGIALQFLDLFDKTANMSYIETAAQGEKFVNLLIEPNGAVKTASELDRYHNGYSTGAIGVAQYQMQLYQRYGNKRNLDYANSILNYIVDKYLKDGYFLVDDKYERLGFGYDLEDGITGLGVVLLNYINTEIKGLDDGYSAYFDDAPVDIIEENTTNDAIMNLMVLGLIMMIFAVFQQRKVSKLPTT